MQLLKKYVPNLSNCGEMTELVIMKNMLIDRQRLMVYADCNGKAMWDTGLLKGAVYNRHLRVINYLASLLQVHYEK